MGPLGRNAASGVDPPTSYRGCFIFGEMDTNVDPASPLQVVNQLIKHDKNFDLLEIPGSNHTSGGPYGDHKRWDFFVQHLLGVTPPRWTALMKATEAQAASAAAADDDDNDPLKSPWVTEGGSN